MIVQRYTIIIELFFSIFIWKLFPFFRNCPPFGCVIVDEVQYKIFRLLKAYQSKHINPNISIETYMYQSEHINPNISIPNISIPNMSIQTYQSKHVNPNMSIQTCQSKHVNPNMLKLNRRQLSCSSLCNHSSLIPKW